MNCHLPLPEQRNLLEKSIENVTLRAEGVTCQACHHPKLQNAEILKESVFCANCHQFKFRHSDVYAQRTYDEWREYKKAGGTRTCQNCHMPKSSHEFHGPHSYKKSRTSLEISLIKRDDSRWQLSIANQRAGHDIPTGDVYRHLTVEGQKVGGSEFQVVANIGRNPFWRTAHNRRELTFKNNNAIRPHETRTYAIPLEMATVRVVYHFEASWAGFNYMGGQPLEQKIIFMQRLDQ